jgi:uncharacterized damage-inducible protein DinB
MNLRAAVSAVVVFASLASAQAAAPDPNNPRTVLHGGLREVGTWVEKAADLVPADKYTYKPVATVRTFGELIAHVADGMNWYCKSAADGKPAPWSDAIEKGKTDKATVTAALKAAHSNCHSVTNTGVIKDLMANVSHTSLHYGNVITYMRMMGLVPPSS